MAKTFIDSPQLSSPDYTVEQELIEGGCRWVCGVDEAGRGPLAGPVVAAAVVLDANHIPAGLHDSKKLSLAKRKHLFDQILKVAEVSVASVSARAIDALNIRAASLYAMTLAVRGLAGPPDHALIDGNAVPPNLSCPATEIVKGDARCVSIAAASIVAKVTRDRMMIRADHFYPGYGLAYHKGYPTKAHVSALIENGPTDLHRFSFAPVQKAQPTAAVTKIVSACN